MKKIKKQISVAKKKTVPQKEGLTVISKEKYEYFKKKIAEI